MPEGTGRAFRVHLSSPPTVRRSSTHVPQRAGASRWKAAMRAGLKRRYPFERQQKSKAAGQMSAVVRLGKTDCRTARPKPTSGY